MFGYVRPLKIALSEEDVAGYKAAYCGLCRVIGQRYGRIAQMFLNYDFAFLAMLLAEKPQEPCLACGRCPVYPWRKKQLWQEDEGLYLAAAESVVLCYWKLKDSLQDEGFWKRCLIRPLLALLRPAYGRATSHCGDFAQTVQQCLEELREMEVANVPYPDRPADAFARLLQAASGRGNEAGQVALSQLLYHLGRWIYLVDAWDDLEEDRKNGSYNPILLQGEGEDHTAILQESLSASLGIVQDALHWMDTGRWTGVLNNIVNLGLPAMQEAVISGAWRNRKKRIIRRSGDE